MRLSLSTRLTAASLLLCLMAGCDAGSDAESARLPTASSTENDDTRRSPGDHAQAAPTSSSASNAAAPVTSAGGGIAGGAGSSALGAGTVGGGTFGGGAVAGSTAGALAPQTSVPPSAALDAGVANPPVDEQAGAAPRVNPFVLTESDPFSTFAADVDTASYDIFRRSLLSGVLPSPSEVRLEEYVNYFHYDYPAPGLSDPEPFSISLAAVDHVAGGATKLLRVGIQGAVPEERKPANLVFLVDVSGSMSAENKLPLVKVVLKEALSELAPTDTISVVTYAADTSVRLAPTPVSQRSAIESVINGLAAGGSTNGASGIQLAYEQAEVAFLEDGINHVVLCTDGDFNVGITDSDQLVSFIEKKRESGVTLTALGFGSRNNDSMMNRVSDAGNGVYSVLYDQDQAIAYAHQRLLSSMIHIAKDMKLQVEFNPERVKAYRLLGYETRKVADTGFRDDRVDGGEVGAGHRVTALYQLVLAGDALPEAAGEGDRGDADASELTPEVLPSELLRVKVRYKQPGASSDAAAKEVVASLLPDAILSDASAADADMRWAVAVASLAELLAQSPYVDVSALPALRALLAPSIGDDADRSELLTLFDKAAPLLKAR